jgi:DNA (cytosine-5)-methyltransferase 1
MGGTVVIGELTEIGYSAEWRLVSAAGMGAPHRRDRVVIVAYPNSKSEPISTEHEVGMVADAAVNKSNGRRPENDFKIVKEKRLQVSAGGSSSPVADAAIGFNVRRLGSGYSNRSEVFSGRDYERGTPSYAGWQWWEIEPDVGRVANGVPSRVDRLRGLGNAVVPQVAEYVGSLVIDHYSRTK